MPVINEQTKKNQPKAKAQERIREEAEKKAAAEAEAKPPLRQQLHLQKNQLQ